MKKLESITEEQKAQRLVIRDKWLDLGLKHHEFDRERFDRGIRWLYCDMLKKPMPDILVVDSPMGAQYGLTLVRALTKDSVGASVGASVRDSVGASVWASVGDSKYESFTPYGSISDYGWVAFYQYFQSIGHPIGDAEKKFNAFVDLLMANHYDMIVMENLVVVCKKPQHIRMDRGVMHCTDGPCIEWADGYKLYAIRGRILPSWIWEDKENHTKERYIGEKNAEYRAGMYAVLGQQRMMEMLGAKSIDTCNDNNETLTLLKTDEAFDTADGRQPYAWVQCNCPSTKTTYLLGVKPHHTKAKAAMAELWGLTEDQYIIGQHT